MFLATTALREFWDADDRLLLLGSWCQRYGDPPTLGRAPLSIVPSPWDDRGRFYDATQYLDVVYERLLIHLADYLDVVHGSNRSRRYWRILIGPWLCHFLHATYDRYVHLEEALRNYPDLRTLALDASSFETPKDSEQCTLWLSDSDRYNLQIFSELLTGMGYSFPAQRWPGERIGSHHRANRPGMTRRAGRLTRRVLGRLRGSGLKALGVERGAVLWDTSVPRRSQLALDLRSGFRATHVPLPSRFAGFDNAPIQNGTRQRLADIPACDAFERLFVRLLPRHFPVLNLEQHERARREIHGNHWWNAAVVASESGWYWNEPFKYLAAEAAAAGGRLLAIQHGGGYGLFRYSALERHETQISDAYCVWGWAPSGSSLRNLPHPKVSPSRRRPTTEPASRSRILFAVQDHPRYLYRFHSTPAGSQWEGQWEWQHRFLAALSHGVRGAVSFRAHPIDCGQGIRERVSAAFHDVRVDSTASYEKAVEASGVVVLDAIGTPLLETLAFNVPTILFWNPERWEVRDEAAPFFDRLRQAGVLWDSPEAAATHLEAVCADPVAWWSTPAIQQARSAFVERYALGARDWVKSWKEVFREEVANARRDS